MKKALKIGGIILGVIIIIAAVIFIFFPGLFTYIKVKKDFPSIDTSVREYKAVEVPQDFVEYEVRGIKISVPKSYTLKDSGIGFVDENDETVVGIMETDNLASLEYAEITGEAYDQWQYNKYDEADYRSYFEAVDAPYPTPYDASTDSLWYIRDTLKAEDCLKLRGTDRDVFLEFAEAKEDSLKIETSQKLSLDGGKAYVSESLDNDIVSYDYTSVTVYTDGGGSKSHIIMIREENEEIAGQIISSIRLAD